MLVGKTNLSLPLFSQGKVRDIYSLSNFLLIVATDRISAFDYVLPTLIPDKGKILTKLSVFWFKKLKSIIDNHFITSEIEQYPHFFSPDEKEIIRERSMLVKKAKRIDIECVVRGYLAGSAWNEYQKNRQICGINLPSGLKESAKLEQPIFTPAYKAESGEHDENISFSKMEEILGDSKLSNFLVQKSISLYKNASDYALQRGIIIADTKFEFGIYEGKVILIDELFTPDSSRFWDKNSYQVGKPQASFDKQFVRDYLISINWEKEPPVPGLPEEVVEKTRQKYLQALYLLTGEKL